MSTAADLLPLTRHETTADAASLAEVVRQCRASNEAIYPLGGGTALDYGVKPQQPGVGLSLSQMNRVIDYPARDMTITVEAGITIEALAEIMAAEGQRLPIDAARASRATLGGVVATNFSGPRRYGYGTIRDYVIGISAVDGLGVEFKGGGRVVKNVAGYDFCKLLTGSLGTLGVITQVTLKVRPVVEASAWLTCDLPDWNRAETLLDALVSSRVTPAAIELVYGPEWQEGATGGDASRPRLLVGLEGTSVEVDWMLAQLEEEWQGLGQTQATKLIDSQAAELWSRLTEFPAAEGASLVVKFNVVPSATTRIMARLLEVDPECSIQAHAGNGIVIGRMKNFSVDQALSVLVRDLQPAARAAGGNAVVLSCAAGELTRQAVWGGMGNDADLMRAVKQQFDPQGLLNPGRFVYGA